MALRATQPLTEMSTRNLPWGGVKYFLYADHVSFRDVFHCTRCKCAMFECETWPISVKDTFILNTWDRRILRELHGPVTEQEIWRIITKNGGHCIKPQTR
jgi:hypothetical protein